MSGSPETDEEVDEVDRAVGQRLSACRASRLITEEHLADLASVSVDELRAIEGGSGKVYASTLFLLSEALGASVRDLLPELH